MTLAKEAGLTLPIVCNTSGYELPEVVQKVSDVIDIWLTDVKYADPQLAKELSYAADYPEMSMAALEVMYDSVMSRGGRKLDDDGRMLQGIIMRHLVMPTHAGWQIGYGSYEVSYDPEFETLRLPILRRAVYAIAHVRGGGEMGRAWYEDGKELVKEHTFTDFVDVADWLVDSGWVAPGRLVAEGRSAGGLLMGAVTNAAPDRFRAILAGVPFVDALTTILDASLPLTVGEWEEWGNPVTSRAVFDAMSRYTPYENVPDGALLPAIMATTSVNDTLSVISYKLTASSFLNLFFLNHSIYVYRFF